MLKIWKIWNFNFQKLQYNTKKYVIIYILHFVLF